MFGRKKAKEAEQARALLELGAKLDALTGEIRALRTENTLIRDEIKAFRAEAAADRVAPEGERDPDVLTESERIQMWLMGEKGDGI